MSRFHPARALIPSDSASSIGISAPDLAKLTTDDVDLIDAVIDRAGPEANTFLTIFKAYNDVLQDHGLDPQEVVYYGKLLKLGTLKGRNWGEKWNMVKLQHGYTATSGPRLRKAAGIPVITSRAPRDSARFPLHYHQDTQPSQPESCLDDTPQYHLTPRPFNEPELALESFEKPSMLTSDMDTGSLSFHHPVLSPRPVSAIVNRRIHDWDVESSGVTELNVPSTPPSYKAAVRDPILRKQYVPRSRDKPYSSPVVHSSPVIHSTPRQNRVFSREPRKSAVNDEEAWNKVKAFQDEKDADRFRQDKLIERCWEVWKQGFQWIRVSTCPFPHPCYFCTLVLIAH
jgi:protein SFI1